MGFRFHIVCKHSTKSGNNLINWLRQTETRFRATDFQYQTRHTVLHDSVTMNAVRLYVLVDYHPVAGSVGDMLVFVDAFLKLSTCMWVFIIWNLRCVAIATLNPLIWILCKFNMQFLCVLFRSFFFFLNILFMCFRSWSVCCAYVENTVTEREM